MHAGVEIYLSAHFPRIDEVVYVIFLKTVHPVHQVEETENVDRGSSILASLLPQVIDGVSIDGSAEKVLDAEHCHRSEQEVHHLVHHHEVIHL